MPIELSKSEINDLIRSISSAIEVLRRARPTAHHQINAEADKLSRLECLKFKMIGMKGGMV